MSKCKPVTYTKAELEETIARTNAENRVLKTTLNDKDLIHIDAIAKLHRDLHGVERNVRDITKQLEAKTESIDYLNDRMSEIRTSLETVAAVKFPSIMLGFDVIYNGAPQEPEDELLSLLRHLYRLTN